MGALSSSEVMRLFEETGAFLSGHFLLSSGLHSSNYLQCARVLCHPDKASILGRELASLFRDVPVDTVISPALGGVVIGQEVARHLGRPHLFTERVDGRMALRRGFEIRAGERFLVIEDVLTTGGSTREVVELVRQGGGVVAAAGAIIHRGAGDAGLDVPFRALATVAVPSWPSEACPLCRTGGDPAVKPGSRGNR